MGSLGTILGPGCHLIQASNDILQTVLQTQYPCIVKGNQRFKPKTQKKHKASDTGVQLSESLKVVYLLVLVFFHSCITEVYLVYNVVSISAIQLSDSAIHIHTFFNILFYYGLS